jgi:hypothetical protein
LSPLFGFLFHCYFAGKLWNLKRPRHQGWEMTYCNPEGWYS